MQISIINNKQWIDEAVKKLYVTLILMSVFLNINSLPYPSFSGQEDKSPPNTENG